MRRTDGAREAITAGLLAAACALLFAASNLGGFAYSLREGVFDRLIEFFPRGGKPADVIAVDIDSASVARLGAWPWSRAQIASLIEKVAVRRPRAIAVNILLDGPDRASARAAIARIARTDKRPDLNAVAESFPDNDALLAKAADSGVPVVFALGIDPGEAARVFSALVLASAQDAPVDLRPVTVRAIAGPPTQVNEAAAGLGVLSLDTDEDGWLRRFPLLFEAVADNQARLHAGFALETIRVAEGVGTIVYDAKARRLEIGDARTPAPRDSLMRFYPRPDGYWKTHTFSAAHVLDGGAMPIGENTIVVIGSSAPEAGAYLPGAALGAVSTLRAQAEAIDLLRSQTAIARAPFAPWSEWIAAGVAGITAIATSLALPPLAAALSVAGLIAAAIGFAALMFSGFSILADVTPAIAATILAAGAAGLSVHSRVRANRALVEARFSRYLAPAVVDILARDPTRLRIEAQRREVTALFTDLEGFTPFSERTPPQQLIETLDTYFEMIAHVVVEHGGMVDKIVGDAVHVFFNMPLDQPDHAERAVRCARAIHEATERYRREARQVALVFGRTRVGVDTGWATVGDVGGRDKLDYTAHGEAVNRAARLQSMARDFPSGVLIGQGTVRRLVSREGLQSAGQVTPRGLSQAQEVFTLA